MCKLKGVQVDSPTKNVFLSYFHWNSLLSKAEPLHMGLKTATPKEDKDEKRIGKLIKRNPKIKRCLRGLYIKHIEITGQANILEAKTST